MLPLIREIVPLRVGNGMPVTIWGYGFNPDCKILIDGDDEATVIDYSIDCITFVSPNNVGEYSVTISVNELSTDSLRLVVDSSALNTVSLKKREEAEFRSALIGLMPRGFAWYTGKDGNWYKFLSAVAFAFSYLYAMLMSLVNEMSPVKTTSLNQWEKELGLPKKGLSYDSDAERLSEIYRIARKQNGATIPFYESVCKLFGVANPQIYEYWKEPNEFDGIDFGTDDPNFYWMIDCGVDVGEVVYATCESTCEDYLSWWGKTAMEILLQEIKPAHTKLLFRYTLPEV